MSLGWTKCFYQLKIKKKGKIIKLRKRLNKEKGRIIVRYKTLKGLMNLEKLFDETYEDETLQVPKKKPNA